MALLFVVVLMFLCSSALWALDLAVLNISIRRYFIDDIELPFSERVSRGRRIIALFSRVQDVIYSFEVRTLSLFKIGYSRGLTSYSFPFKFGLGDCIVVWRACVLTRDLPKLWAVLIALLIGSFGQPILLRTTALFALTTATYEYTHSFEPGFRWLHHS